MEFHANADEINTSISFKQCDESQYKTRKLKSNVSGPPIQHRLAL